MYSVGTGLTGLAGLADTDLRYLSTSQYTLSLYRVGDIYKPNTKSGDGGQTQAKVEMKLKLKLDIKQAEVINLTA